MQANADKILDTFSPSEIMEAAKDIVHATIGNKQLIADFLTRKGSDLADISAKLTDLKACLEIIEKIEDWN